MPTAWELVADGFGRLEAPCVDGRGRIHVSDMADEGGVYRLEHEGGWTDLATRGHVGGLVPHTDGGLVASGPNVAHLAGDGTERVLREPIGGWGFNDLTTDALGQVYVGMHGERPSASQPARSASLWLLRPGGEAVHCYDGI